jgi:beta-phosphoglucomutase
LLDFSNVNVQNKDVALQRLYFFMAKSTIKNMNDSKIACIFDMDGTMVHNIPAHREAWKSVIAKYDLTYSHELFNHFTSNKDIFTALFGRELSEAEWRGYSDEKEAIYHATYRPVMKPMKGLRRLLQSLRKNEVSAAVGTAAPTLNADFIIDGLKLRPYFQTIVDITQVENSKPHPEIFLTAAARLGVLPENCVVFEDSIPGVEAGKRAGMTVVAITTTHTAEELVQADYIIKDYSEVSVEKIKLWVS